MFLDQDAGPSRPTRTEIMDELCDLGIRFRLTVSTFLRDVLFENLFFPALSVVSLLWKLELEYCKKFVLLLGIQNYAFIISKNHFRFNKIS